MYSIPNRGGGIEYAAGLCRYPIRASSLQVSTHVDSIWIGYGVGGSSHPGARAHARVDLILDTRYNRPPIDGGSGGKTKKTALRKTPTPGLWAAFVRSEHLPAFRVESRVAGQSRFARKPDVARDSHQIRQYAQVKPGARPNRYGVLRAESHRRPDLRT